MTGAYGPGDGFGRREVLAVGTVTSLETRGQIRAGDLVAWGSRAVPDQKMGVVVYLGPCFSRDLVAVFGRGGWVSAEETDRYLAAPVSRYRWRPKTDVGHIIRLEKTVWPASVTATKDLYYCPKGQVFVLGPAPLG